MHSSFAHSTSSPSRPARGHGFTLLEVLLTIAIIALLATALIGGSARLLNQQPLSVNEVFWKSVQEARKTALKAEHEIRFRYDREKKQFLLIDGVAPAALAADGFTKEEVALKAFAIPPAATSDLIIDLLGPVAKGGNVILVGGMLLESTPIKFVTFYADGTCSPFRLQISRNGGVHVLSIDPWTCAPILAPPDPNAPPAY